MRARSYSASVSLIAALALAAPSAANAASPLTTLWTFAGGSAQPPDGAFPQAGLISDSTGALYGTTVEGGNPSCGGGCGTVFKLTPPSMADGAWTETVLYSFTGGSDGGYPEAGLIFGTDGALYGTTVIGGNTSCVDGCGTVFKLAPPSTAGGAWTETALYSFTGRSDGARPHAGLISDSTGALYSTTSEGGNTSCQGCGTVFKLTPPSMAGGAWTETLLHSFSGSDGAYPYAGLISDSTGALYSTTSEGGNTSCTLDLPFSCGTVFKLTPPSMAGGAWTETVLHSFTGSDGAHPFAGLISDSTGALYGTTEIGAGDTEYGTVFKLMPSSTAGGAWTETVLYIFAGGSDGANPISGLISDRTGALYSTTPGGGNPSCEGCGTVFKLTPPSTAGGAWTETVLYSFTGGSDGRSPQSAGLIFGTDGALYGTTYQGGNASCALNGYGCGTVFKLTPPVTFAGAPGEANCYGKSVSALTQQYGGLAAVAAALDYSTVQALQNAIAAYCAG